ncbi:MAG: hypothetical protein PHW69_07875 [Elusimicrobiaceae bacterium]|nr:hypothetical protein [Elusimicrobiaceae bacterium]
MRILKCMLAVFAMAPLMGMPAMSAEQADENKFCALMDKVSAGAVYYGEIMQRNTQRIDQLAAHLNENALRPNRINIDLVTKAATDMFVSRLDIGRMSVPLAYSLDMRVPKTENAYNKVTEAMQALQNQRAQARQLMDKATALDQLANSLKPVTTEDTIYTTDFHRLCEKTAETVGQAKEYLSDLDFINGRLQTLLDRVKPDGK